MDNLAWREKLEKFKLPIGLSLVGIVLMLGGIFSSGLTNSQPKSFPKESLVETQKTNSVDVSGAVTNPGVYQLKDGARIEDAIKAAGGFSQDANKVYISKSLNMAQKLSDGTKVYVPFEGESGVSGQGGAVAGTTAQAKVNINTALQSDLENLPGIGPVTASKIISDRPYQAVEDLLNKKVVSKAVFEKNKDMISVY